MTPLFIKCTRGSCYIKQVLVNYGLDVNVISYDNTLLNMHYTNDDIQSTYKAFYSHETVPMGKVKIPIIWGPITLITTCLVIN